MDEQAQLAERFETERGRLRAVAYRMLGSVSEADDAVQEAWIKVSRADSGAVENMGGWLTTVVARVCLNMLRARKSRREVSLHLRVPEPIVDREDGVDPEHVALIGDSVGLALLVVLDALTPAERVAFVLHDVFGVSFEEMVRSSDAPPPPPGNWRAGRAAGSGEALRFPIGTCVGSDRSSTRSSLPFGTATSRGSSRCSIRQSFCAQTVARYGPGHARAPRRRDRCALGAFDHPATHRVRCAKRTGERSGGHRHTGPERSAGVRDGLHGSGRQTHRDLRPGPTGCRSFERS